MTQKFCRSIPKSYSLRLRRPARPPPAPLFKRYFSRVHRAHRLQHAADSMKISASVLAGYKTLCKRHTTCHRTHPTPAFKIPIERVSVRSLEKDHVVCLGCPARGKLLPIPATVSPRRPGASTLGYVLTSH